MSNQQTLIAELREMIAARGSEVYGGEQVTVAEHSIQTAQCAEDAGAAPHLIVAALLHDIGHFLHDDFEGAQERGEDRCHEDLGGDFLKKWFAPQITEPVRLHVAAKRYLCAVNPDYSAKLSPASTHTLGMQGGPMSADEVAAFERNPGYRDAVRLRLWDDMAKDPEMKTESLEHFLKLVGALVT